MHPVTTPRSPLLPFLLSATVIACATTLAFQILSKKYYPSFHKFTAKMAVGTTLLGISSAITCLLGTKKETTMPVVQARALEKKIYDRLGKEIEIESLKEGFVTAEAKQAILKLYDDLEIQFDQLPESVKSHLKKIERYIEASNFSHEIEERLELLLQEALNYRFTINHAIPVPALPKEYFYCKWNPARPTSRTEAYSDRIPGGESLSYIGSDLKKRDVIVKNLKEIKQSLITKLDLKETDDSFRLLSRFIDTAYSRPLVEAEQFLYLAARVHYYTYYSNKKKILEILQSTEWDGYERVGAFAQFSQIAHLNDYERVKNDNPFDTMYARMVHKKRMLLSKFYYLHLATNEEDILGGWRTLRDDSDGRLHVNPGKKLPPVNEDRAIVKEAAVYVTTNLSAYDLYKAYPSKSPLAKPWPLLIEEQFLVVIPEKRTDYSADLLEPHYSNYQQGIMTAKSNHAKALAYKERFDRISLETTEGITYLGDNWGYVYDRLNQSEEPDKILTTFVTPGKAFLALKPKVDALCAHLKKMKELAEGLRNPQNTDELSALKQPLPNNALSFDKLLEEMDKMDLNVWNKDPSILTLYREYKPRVETRSKTAPGTHWQKNFTSVGSRQLL